MGEQPLGLRVCIHTCGYMYTRCYSRFHVDPALLSQPINQSPSPCTIMLTPNQSPLFKHFPKFYSSAPASYLTPLKRKKSGANLQRHEHHGENTWGEHVPGPWSLVLVPGPWSLVPCPSSLVPGPLSLVPGPRSTINDH